MQTCQSLPKEFFTEHTRIYTNGKMDSMEEKLRLFREKKQKAADSIRTTKSVIHGTANAKKVDIKRSVTNKASIIKCSDSSSAQLKSVSVNLVSKPLAFASVIADALSSPLPRPVPHRTLASTPLTTADSFNAPEPIVPLQDKLLLWKAEKENRQNSIPGVTPARLACVPLTPRSTQLDSTLAAIHAYIQEEKFVLATNILDSLLLHASSTLLAHAHHRTDYWLARLWLAQRYQHAGVDTIVTLLQQAKQYRPVPVRAFHQAVQDVLLSLTGISTADLAELTLADVDSNALVVMDSDSDTDTEEVAQQIAAGRDRYTLTATIAALAQKTPMKFTLPSMHTSVATTPALFISPMQTVTALTSEINSRPSVMTALLSDIGDRSKTALESTSGLMSVDPDSVETDQHTSSDRVAFLQSPVMKKLRTVAGSIGSVRKNTLTPVSEALRQRLHDDEERQCSEPTPRQLARAAAAVVVDRQKAASAVVVPMRQNLMDEFGVASPVSVSNIATSNKKALTSSILPDDQPLEATAQSIITKYLSMAVENDDDDNENEERSLGAAELDSLLTNDEHMSSSIGVEFELGNAVESESVSSSTATTFEPTASTSPASVSLKLVKPAAKRTVRVSSTAASASTTLVSSSSRNSVGLVRILSPIPATASQTLINKSKFFMSPVRRSVRLTPARQNAQCESELTPLWHKANMVYKSNTVMPDTIEDVAFIDSSRKAAASSCTFIPADFPTCIEVESIDTEPKSVVLPLMSNKPSMQLMRDTSSTSTVDKVMLLQVTPTSKPAAFSEQALLICASAPRAYVAPTILPSHTPSFVGSSGRFGGGGLFSGARRVSQSETTTVDRMMSSPQPVIPSSLRSDLGISVLSNSPLATLATSTTAVLQTSDLASRSVASSASISPPVQKPLMASKVVSPVIDEDEEQEITFGSTTPLKPRSHQVGTRTIFGSTPIPIPMSKLSPGSMARGALARTQKLVAATPRSAMKKSQVFGAAMVVGSVAREKKRVVFSQHLREVREIVRINPHASPDADPYKVRSVYASFAPIEEPLNPTPLSPSLVEQPTKVVNCQPESVATAAIASSNPAISKSGNATIPDSTSAPFPSSLGVLVPESNVSPIRSYPAAVQFEIDFKETASVASFIAAEKPMFQVRNCTTSQQPVDVDDEKRGETYIFVPNEMQLKPWLKPKTVSACKHVTVLTTVASPCPSAALNSKSRIPNFQCYSEIIGSVTKKIANAVNGVVLVEALAKTASPVSEKTPLRRSTRRISNVAAAGSN